MIASKPPRFLDVALIASVLLYAACAADDQSEAPGDGGEGGSAGKSAGAGKSNGGSSAPGTSGAGVADSGEGGTAGKAELPEEPGLFALGSVVIDAEGARTTYLQTLSSLDAGPFDNDTGIEIPGNGTFLSNGESVFAGLEESPTWVRYTPDANGTLKETGRLSFLDYGITYMDFGNAIVSDEIAVSVLSGPAVAVIWNPKTLEITKEVDLSHLVVDTFGLEVWTTVAHDGLVYVPGRWADWEGGRIRNGVSMTIIDPVAGEIVGVAEDDRCASGGRVVFDKDGYAYVMGDGRNYSAKMFAKAANAPAPPDNCLLRIAPGATDFEEDFYYTIPSLTGGLESITELETAVDGSGLGFAKMFYPDKLPEGVEPVDFDFWDESAHKMWRIELGDPPVAKEVDGLPFAAIGFSPSAFRGKLYSGESVDGGVTSDVYETDPEANEGALRFKMVGYFSGLFELKGAVK